MVINVYILLDYYCVVYRACNFILVFQDISVLFGSKLQCYQHSNMSVRLVSCNLLSAYNAVIFDSRGPCKHHFVLPIQVEGLYTYQ